MEFRPAIWRGIHYTAGSVSKQDKMNSAIWYAIQVVKLTSLSLDPLIFQKMKE